MKTYDKATMQTIESLMNQEGLSKFLEITAAVCDIQRRESQYQGEIVLGEAYRYAGIMLERMASRLGDVD